MKKTTVWILTIALIAVTAGCSNPAPTISVQNDESVEITESSVSESTEYVDESTEDESSYSSSASSRSYESSYSSFASSRSYESSYPSSASSRSYESSYPSSSRSTTSRSYESSYPSSASSRSYESSYPSSSRSTTSRSYESSYPSSSRSTTSRSYESSYPSSASSKSYDSSYSTSSRSTSGNSGPKAKNAEIKKNLDELLLNQSLKTVYKAFEKAYGTDYVESHLYYYDCVEGKDIMLMGNWTIKSWKISGNKLILGCQKTTNILKRLNKKLDQIINSDAYQVVTKIGDFIGTAKDLGLIDDE